MIILDDAGLAKVVEVTVSAIEDGAHHIGKADRDITKDQIEKVRMAITSLEETLDFKERVSSHRL